MDFTQILTWVMVIVGFIGFRFVGLKKWWAWYINLACQILWATYALVTGQLAFLASAAAYFVIFAWNAYKWTKDHLIVKKILSEDDGMIIHNTKLDGSQLYTIPENPSTVKRFLRTEELVGIQFEGTPESAKEITEWVKSIVGNQYQRGLMQRMTGKASTEAILHIAINELPATYHVNAPTDTYIVYDAKESEVRFRVVSPNRLAYFKQETINADIP